MDKKQYIKNLAELYFNGKIQPAQEKELFGFINSNGKNMAIFREWEKEWIASTINDSELNLGKFPILGCHLLDGCLLAPV